MGTTMDEPKYQKADEKKSKLCKNSFSEAKIC